MTGENKYFMKTERLGFRQWMSADLPLALAIWGDAKVTRLVGGPFSKEKVVARLEREIASMIAFRVQYWPIFLLKTGHHVGAAGMRVRESQEPRYSVGYYLLPEFWGQGLATEAGRAVIKYAFEMLEARSLFAGHHPENAISGRVLEKLVSISLIRSYTRRLDSCTIPTCSTGLRGSPPNWINSVPSLSW